MSLSNQYKQYINIIKQSLGVFKSKDDILSFYQDGGEWESLSTRDLMARFEHLRGRWSKANDMEKAGAYLPGGSHGDPEALAKVEAALGLIVLETTLLWDALEIRAPWMLARFSNHLE